MAAALQDLLGDRLTGGLIVTKYGHADPQQDTGPIVAVEAGHPIPDEAGVNGAGRMRSLLRQATQKDLVLRSSRAADRRC